MRIGENLVVNYNDIVCGGFLENSARMIFFSGGHPRRFGVSLILGRHRRTQDSLFQALGQMGHRKSGHGTSGIPILFFFFNRPLSSRARFFDRPNDRELGTG